MFRAIKELLAAARKRWEQLPGQFGEIVPRPDGFAVVAEGKTHYARNWTTIYGEHWFKNPPN